MTKFTQSLYSTSASALGLALLLAGASSAFAQTVQPAVGSDTSASSAPNSDDQEIVVTGFRAALRSATARKKKAETVVESVSSEDIGKLPDNSIGESIARLPGLASQRNAGRANIISIRGFGPDFSTTTLNGRQQTTSNDSRAVEFDQYPSEILAGVDVYKTTEADHTAGGLVGSIDLRTLRPLEVGHRIVAIGARGVYVDQKLQPKSKDKGGRVYGTYVDQFADGKVGVALSASYTSDPYQTRDWNAWGYGGYSGSGQIMNGVKTWFESDQLKRFGGNATIEAKLRDNLTMSVDGFYSDFTDNVDKRGWEMPMNCGGGCGHDQILSTTVENGLVTAATVRGTPVIENYAIDRKTKQLSLGWNAKWDGHNGWKALADVSYSRTNRRDHNLETTAGLGRALPNATATVSYKFTDHGPEFVSDYNGASSALVLTDVEGWSGSPVQAGYDKVRKSHDDLKELRGEIEREVGGGFIRSIKLGADYTDRKKFVTQDEAFLSPPNGALTAAIPANLLLTPVNLDRGLGPILAFDPRAIVASGVLAFLPNRSGASQGYNLREKVWTPYAMAPIEADLGTAHLTGNIGVQGIHTSVKSVGFAKPTISDDYWMVLPSLNLNFRFQNDVVVRFALAKQMMRPRLDQLNNNVGFSIDNTQKPPIYTGGGGNPLLRPYQAKAVDLNIEKYFGTKGYIALQSFYKHLDTYIDQQATSTPYIFPPWVFTGPLKMPIGDAGGLPAGLGKPE